MNVKASDTNNIHPTAIISEGAVVASSAKIGAYTVINGEVNIGNNVKIHNNVNIGGENSIVTIGNNCQIFPFASIGSAPQDLKYKGNKTKLTIGQGNIFREHATVNIGTEDGGGITQIGDGCLFMIGTHIAHDCVIGNDVILANNATLAGHVEVGDGAVIGGLAAVHQFVRIGKSAMIGGLSGIETDIIPYGMAMGERASLEGLNLVGMKRKQMLRKDIILVKEIYQKLFHHKENESGNITHKPLQTKLQELESEYDGETLNIASIKQLLDFIKATSKRGICGN